MRQDDAEQAKHLDPLLCHEVFEFLRQPPPIHDFRLTVSEPLRLIEQPGIGIRVPAAVGRRFGLDELCHSLSDSVRLRILDLALRG